MELVPDVLGSAAYAVFLERFPEGGASDDDFAVFPMLAARDSTRVLHIAGHPSWDVRFLRQFLTGTPGMELVSFYLLVEAEDFAPHSREELALIPFPTDELFLRELGNFDLVIVHNFPLGSYFLLKETHLRRLVRFVEEGGGVLFIGGDKAFSLGALQGSPAAALLPAGLPAAEEPDLYVQGPADAVLEPEGLTHPVTTTRSGDEEIPLRLAGLPPLAGVSRLGEVAGWGQLLASARVGGRSHPLLVAGRYGKGRVLALSTDSLWKWAFPAELSHESPAVYRTLLLNALAWLVRDPRMDEAAVLSESGVLAERKEGVVRVCIRGAAQPGTVARVEAEWLDASGKLPSLRLDLTAPLSDGRCARVSFPPAPPGAWLVTASLESDNREFEGSATLVVERRRETWLSEFMRRLRPLLEVRFVPFVLDPVYPVVPGLSKMVLHKPVVRPLWDTPVPFAALVVFLAAEWLLRRRWGYL
ncbi:MAG: hypothetical protein FJ098_16190 [Deltaproteobacteria bacterium]|nr:hypothetical protein [Deltaproteobacteria bacterium]